MSMLTMPPEAAQAECLRRVAAHAALLQAAPDGPPPVPEAEPRHALILAPHPDDECINGALPLRLHQEAGWRVTALAVTLGSAPARQAERWAEMQAACDQLGFEPRSLGDAPLHELLAALQPDLVLLPHAQDDNPTHRRVHAAGIAALAEAGLSTFLACTEFWSTQAAPNALVQTSCADTARLMAALMAHQGEIARNPYHLRLPAFMADSVRRGGELVGGPGSAPPDFAFATLYRLVRVEGGQLADDLPCRIHPAASALTAARLFASP
ncbi:PIG-L deacetylase family protein [Roseateles paludis]|jgi:LmbE family N-acetylglucosaminyl deacetylase|uniref:PIG-L family deacetylase n=1 Tax=Roseateles paludis TaxID=3145238 RepID=A0ABV0G5Y0_9BURK